LNKVPSEYNARPVVRKVWRAGHMIFISLFKLELKKNYVSYFNNIKMDLKEIGLGDVG
jgi:hypothetical protein